MNNDYILVVNAGDDENEDNIVPIIDIIKMLRPDIRTVVSPYQQAEQLAINNPPKLQIFSGRAQDDPTHKLSQIKPYYSWIIPSKIPTITICGSYQRMLVAIGAKLTLSGSAAETGIIPIKLQQTSKDPLHKDFSQSKAYLHNGHRYFIKMTNLPDEFRILGTSNRGLAIVKHNTLPIYGFQGHPERTSPQNVPRAYSAYQYSTRLFHNFLNFASF